MAKSIAYPITQDAAPEKTHWTVRTFFDKAETGSAEANQQELSLEDATIVMALNEAAKDMAYLHRCFDYVTEEILVDCLIYELKAVSLRHKYFHELCKAKGIVGGYTV